MGKITGVGFKPGRKGKGVKSEWTGEGKETRAPSQFTLFQAANIKGNGATADAFRNEQQREIQALARK